ncbi:KTSC domain-containing protein [Clostridium estertheticum]|uniref:KTSC domain-containing protein n=1 Tax=Clostridium estertheticum TaxID=238834 RepID=A0AA47EG68_9CLOT|nr:KTSC domain-containing protein [Clostridium estertheticum]MBU3156342.1 KTSC domain-containing protein [Clostridium estertheticum]WAG59609.1 KTSC domain-containing protein [Clostridium estertheticum]
MERFQVESSNIDAITYDENSCILEIEFKAGGAYEYSDVPMYVYDELMSADSKGRYANQNIYKNYTTNKKR